jgi:hypothetical protein
MFSSFRVNTISGASAAAPESYYFMYSSELAYMDGIQVDASGNHFVSKSGTPEYYKITSAGTIAWQKSLTGGYTNSGSGSKMVLDSSDNLVIALADDSADDKATLVNLSNSTGAQNWANHRTATPYRRNSGVVNLSDGSFITVGYGGSSANVLWTKYNSSGAYVSQLSLSANASTGFGQIVRDSSDNVYTVWQRSSNNERGVMKLNSSLTQQWNRTISGTNWFGANQITCDPSGNVYVIQGDKLIKVDTNGSKVWEVTSTQYQSETGNCLAVDTDNNVYSIGYSDGIGYLRKVDSSGTLVWYRKITTSAADVQLRAITVKGSNLYVCGEATLSSVFSSFIIKIPTDGSKTGTYGSGLFSYLAHNATLSSSSVLTVANSTISSSSTASANTTKTLTYNNLSVSSLTNTIL